MNCDYLIVGAGLFGCCVAECIARKLGRSVIVIDRRSHIGGNCYSETDTQTGIETHKYGTHIFHTSSKEAYEYISRFTEFNGYHHQVLTKHRGKVFQMPINLETICSFYNRTMNPSDARKFIQEEANKERIENPKNLEEKAISLIGRPLYEAFIRGYTIKQWNKDPVELPAEIITRLPVRFDYKEDYFNDARWQGIPLDGYTSIFERMIDSPNITLRLNCDFFENRNAFKVAKATIFTGPVDRLFDYRLGKLEWRSITLERHVESVGDFQGTSVMNYADADVDFTRIHEPRHLHPERTYPNDKTVIFYERSATDSDDPTYPINTPKNKDVASKYKEMASLSGNLVVGGRLGNYLYLDMDKTILAALECFRTKIVPLEHA